MFATLSNKIAFAIIMVFAALGALQLGEKISQELMRISMRLETIVR